MVVVAIVVGLAVERALATDKEEVVAAGPVMMALEGMAAAGTEAATVGAMAVAMVASVLQAVVTKAAAVMVDKAAEVARVAKEVEKDWPVAPAGCTRS